MEKQKETDSLRYMPLGGSETPQGLQIESLLWVSLWFFFVVLVVGLFIAGQDLINNSNIKAMERQAPTADQLNVARFQFAVGYVYPNLTYSEKLGVQRFIFAHKLAIANQS